MKIRIHPALYIYLLSILMLSSWETILGAMVSLLVHELGHYWVCFLVHEHIELLELTPLGGIMVYQQGKSPCKGFRGFCVGAAGPAANYLLLAYIHSIADCLQAGLIRSIVLSCTAMLLVNMIPALPLDGGRMIFSLGYYIFPVSTLITFLMGTGIAAGIGLLLLAIYGLISQGVFNCSLLIIGAYLIYSAWQSRERMLSENLFAVIQETEEKAHLIHRINSYRVPSDTLLLRLLPYLDRRNICEFIFEVDEREYRISENQIRKHLLDQPMRSIKEAYFKHNSL